MAKSPDEKQHDRELQEQFANLVHDERRAIMKAVNRGRAVEVRRHAPLAVMIAQRQIRFWRWAWLIAPALGVGQLLWAEAEVALMNGLFGTLVLVTLAWYWVRRARLSVAANTTLQKGRVGPPSASDTRSRTDTSSGDAQSPATSPRPPTPRGRKRRDRRQP